MEFFAKILFLFLLPCLLPVIIETYAGKILAVEFFSSKSHKITYMSLLEQLGLRGHNITVITPIKGTKKMENVSEVLSLNWEEVMAAEFEQDLYRMKENNEDANPFLMVPLFSKICEETYDLPQIQALLDEKFDLIFMQPIFNDCALGLVHRLKAPLVLFSCVNVPSFIAEKVGNHFPPSFQPNLFLGYPEEMTFSQRFVNFGLNMVLDGILRFHFELAMEAVYRKMLGQDVPSVRTILANASLVLSNGHFSLHPLKPHFPDIVDVGGIHSHPALPLPKDLEDFIQKGKHGFIFFSMGTAVSGSLMPDKKRQIFVNVFGKLKQQVIWKWEKDSMPEVLPANIKLTKWAPQQDLLGHKDIKMFITHCGGGSTEEAIYHGVPLLGIPMFGDQPMNAKLAEKHGFIVELDWNALTEDILYSGIQDILKNSTYRDNVKKLSALFKDQPDDPMKRGIYWVEYVMRHHGAPHLRNAGRNMNYFQYHSFDVILAYVGLMSVTVFVTFIVMRFAARNVYRCFIKQGNATKSKSE